MSRRSPFDFPLVQLQHSLMSHPEYTSSSLRVHFDITSLALRFHFGVTLKSLWFHSDFMWVPCLLHSDYTTIQIEFSLSSRRLHFGVILISHSCHIEGTHNLVWCHIGFLSVATSRLDVDVFSMSLRSHCYLTLVPL